VPTLNRILLFAILASVLRAADDVPQWVRDAAATPAHGYPAKVSRVMLLSDEAVTVDPDGRRVMRERGAIRVLQSGGDPIEAYRTYNTRSGRIRDFQGWLVPPSGKASPYPKNRVIDVAVSSNWDEDRAKLLEAGLLVPGSVFVWEVTEEEKTAFTQYGYAFQGRLPTVISRFSMTVPAGWEVRETMLNWPKIDPQVNGATYTWELHELPWVEREEHSPTVAALVPRLMVSYFPPSDNRAGLQGLKDWTAVSAWLSRLMDPPAVPVEAVKTKAARLTADADREGDGDREMHKIRAIAAFVQAITYVSIDMNITRGGGYTPHRAEETLARNYGDCKDKAALMRALLRASGIDSYAVAIYASDSAYVRPEWASPFQFNHAIVAIRVPDAVVLPTVIPESPVGRLLLFDPTDPVTPVGDLPKDEQGSYALLIAEDRGGLLTMPVLSAEANRIESLVKGTLGADGRIEARIERDYYGQSGIALREIQKLQGADEVRKRFERGLSRQLNELTIKRVDTDLKDENRLAVKIDLVADRFGQVTQGRLFILRPGLLTSGGDYVFTARNRTAAIRLESDLRRDSIRIKLPPGFQLDELPEAATIESPYGKLHVSWVIHEGEIVMEQTLEVKKTIAPASEYARVLDFFDRVAGAEGAPVVLVRR
jgi:transglutaminase-like putative cysteine protease